MRIATEKMKHCLIYSHEIFYVTKNCLFKYSATYNVFKFNYTSRPLRKHDVIKVCSIEYLTTETQMVLPTFNSWTGYKIIEHFTLGLLSSL